MHALTNSLTFMRTRAGGNSEDSNGLIFRVLTHPLAPYVLPVFLWVVAWESQRLVSSLSLPPALMDAVYFTAGARIFSILIFGFRGVIGLVAGSAITHLYFTSDQYNLPQLDLLLYATVQTLVYFGIIKLYLKAISVDDDLTGFKISHVFWLVLLTAFIGTGLRHLFFDNFFQSTAPLSFVFWKGILEFVGRVVGSMLFLSVILCLGNVLVTTDKKST